MNNKSMTYKELLNTLKGMNAELNEMLATIDNQGGAKMDKITQFKILVMYKDGVTSSIYCSREQVDNHICVLKESPSVRKIQLYGFVGSYQNGNYKYITSYTPFERGFKL